MQGHLVLWSTGFRAFRLQQLWHMASVVVAPRALSGKQQEPWAYFLNVCVLVTQWCLTLCDPMDCSLPDSSVHGILWARILEWLAISLSDCLNEYPQNRIS